MGDPERPAVTPSPLEAGSNPKSNTYASPGGAVTGESRPTGASALAEGSEPLVDEIFEERRGLPMDVAPSPDEELQALQRDVARLARTVREVASGAKTAAATQFQRKTNHIVLVAADHPLRSALIAALAGIVFGLRK